MAQHRKKSGRRPGSFRTCAGCRKRLPREQSLRLVAGPEGQLLPDLYGRLPGRGVHLCPNLGCLRKAAEIHSLSRVLHAPAAVVNPEALAASLLGSFHSQVLAMVAVAARCDSLLAGNDAVERALQDGRVALLFFASDASADNHRKVLQLAEDRGVPSCRLLNNEELSRYHHGKPVAVAGVMHRGIARRLLVEIQKAETLAASLGGGNPEAHRHLTAPAVCGKMPQPRTSARVGRS